MKQFKKLTVLTCAAIIAGAACSKKSDSSSANPAPAPTPAPVTMAKKEISATLTKNADGSSAIDLVLPDIAGVNTSHLGVADLNRDTELRSADGKSIAALKVYNNFDTLVTAQYQADRSDAKLHILNLNAKAGNPNAYEVILTNIPIERNNALVRVESALVETSEVCKLSKSQSIASLAEYLKKNPTSSLEQYVDAKRTEAKSSDSKTCAAYDFTIGADGKITITAVPRSNDSENSGPGRNRPRGHHRPQEDGDDQQRPQHRHNEPGQQSQFPAPWPKDSQYSPPSQQYSPPSQQQVPPSQQYSPPSQQQAPPSQYTPPTQQQEAPPSQYAPPVHQHVPPAQQQEIPPSQQQQQQVVPQGYHTNWEACYASGYWRTDGNLYCKQKWWTNCSPEEGGKVCKIKAKSNQSDQKADQKGPVQKGPVQKGPDSQYPQEQQSPPPSQYSPPSQQQAPPSQYSPPSQQQVPPSQSQYTPDQSQYRPAKAEWTTDFNVCYAAGKWKTDGNNYCKKDFWPNCSPDTGGNKCKPQYD